MPIGYGTDSIPEFVPSATHLLAGQASPQSRGQDRFARTVHPTRLGPAEAGPCDATTNVTTRALVVALISMTSMKRGEEVRPGSGQEGSAKAWSWRSAMRSKCRRLRVTRGRLKARAVDAIHKSFCPMDR